MPFWPSGALQLPHSLVSGEAAPLSFFVDAISGGKNQATEISWKLD
jgi:hypothetical protein